MKKVQRELVIMWAAHLKQDTAVVWVKRANRDTLSEVIKYSIDPVDLLSMGKRAVEAIRCMRHTRATQCWGSCHGLAKEARRQANERKSGCRCEGCQNPSFMPSSVAMPRVDYERHRKSQADKLTKWHNGIRQKDKDVTKLKKAFVPVVKYQKAMEGRIKRYALHL